MHEKNLLNSLWGRVLETDMEGGNERNIVLGLRSTKIRKHQDGYGVLVGETRGNTFAKTLLFTEFNVIKN